MGQPGWRFTSLLMCFMVAACDRPPMRNTAAATPAADGKPARFEIRDLRVLRSADELARVTFRARATLVAKDDNVRKGAYLVLLKQTRKQGDLPVDDSNRMIAVVDGIGIIEAAAPGGNPGDGFRSAPEYKFSIIGFVPLSPGQLDGGPGAGS